RLAGVIKGKNKKQLARRPAPGKWSIAEIVAHLADAEIAIAWRLRQILSNNGNPGQAFHQDAWATTVHYPPRHPKESPELYRVLREANLAMLKAAPRQLWENYGVHQERGNESIGHIVRMIAGHDLNHLRQVEQILNGTR